MLARLARTLFWLSAVAAAAALLGPPRHATWLTALAGIALLGSYGLWRLALARQRAARPDDGPDTLAPVRLDEAMLLELGLRTGRACADAASLEAALHAVAAVLRAELGAREMSVHRVLAVEPPLARLVTLIDAPHAGRGIAHEVRLEHGPLGHAVRDRRVAGRIPGPFALPVTQGEPVIAVLELGPIALDAAPAALDAALELVRQQLGEAARRWPA